MDDNVLAILLPQFAGAMPSDPETIEKLRSPDPVAALSEPYHVPVVEFAADDPAMQAAVAEARRRWPEFVAAFSSQNPDGNESYNVKVRLEFNDQPEYIWIEVTRLDGESIHGLLGNTSVSDPTMTVGTPIRSTVEDLHDWMFVRGDELTGGFSVKVIKEALERQMKQG